MVDVIPSRVEENILEYMLGGHACFCIKQVNDGKAYSAWYKIKKSESHGYTIYTVSFIDGNTPKYCGYFNRNNIGNLVGLSVSNKSSEVEDRFVKPLIKVINRLAKGKPLWDEVSVYSNGKCSLCGRPLRDEESIRRGIGPECYKKLGIS